MTQNTKDSHAQTYRLELIVCLLLVLATTGVFWRVANHDFVNYDDTLYVVGDLNFSPQWGEAPESYGPWVLDLRLASTGTQIHRQELTDVRFVNAILVDPVFPRLYISAILADWKGALLILDRRSLAEVGRIQFPRADYDGILVSGGSAGSLFLALGNAGWDSGISINQFDLMP